MIGKHVFILRYSTGGVIGVYSTIEKARKEREEYKSNTMMYKGLKIEEFMIA